jgi:F420-dependent oxidoreductase-like protein
MIERSRSVPTLRWGFKTAQQHATYDDIRALWLEGDQNPVFEHAWLFDHFAPVVGGLDGDCLEGYALLAALAAETERLRIGLMVAGNTYRHPAVTAKLAATIDHISHGRFDFGFGAGWNQYEHESMGIELYPPGERLRRFAEACEVVRRLLTQPITDFDGAHYQLKEARCEPKPIQKPYPPFVIGGDGEKVTLKIAARYADIWNSNTSDPAVFARKVRILREHCATVGRDPGDIELSVQYRIDPENLDAAVKVVSGMVAEGATHLILYIPSPWPDGILNRIADEVISRVESN